MAVVSISLNENLLEKLEDIEKSVGYSGRSEVIRTAVRDFISEKEDLEDLEGDITAVLNVRHENDAGIDIHDYQGLVRSQLHDHDGKGNCLQVFILEGDVDKVVEMYEFIESRKGVLKADLST